MTLAELRTYKRILICGYGLEGAVSEKYIRTYHPTAQVDITDERDGPGYLDKQDAYDLLIRTPAMHPSKLRRPYTTATNLFFGSMPNPVIGITGTKGKSTAASLLHHIFITVGRKAHLYGNIGVPMLQACLDTIPAQDIIILELSSYQLQDCTYSPHIGCFLNIYQELHNHTDFDEYFHAKTAIGRYQNTEDAFFYNGTSKLLCDFAASLSCRVFDFSVTELSSALRSAAPHTHEDTLKAVVALARHADIKDENMIPAMHTYKSLPHRLATVGTFRDVTFIDDSASTHPESAVSALTQVQGVSAIILGGEDRGYDLQPLVLTLQRLGVPHIILLSETGVILRHMLSTIPSYKPELHDAHSMDDAVQLAYTHALPGSVCLLSPGAPSYTMFTNFSERGDRFVSYVEKYGSQKAIKTSSQT